MNVTEIKIIISQLPPPELVERPEWIEELKADAWDRLNSRYAVMSKA